MRLLEHARVVVHGPGVAAAACTEQVGRHQRIRDGGQVGDDQRTFHARPRVQHVLGKKALSRARFPLDQHGQWAASQHLEPPPQLGHRRRSSPDYGAFLVRRTEAIEARDAQPAVRGLILDCQGVAHRPRANARDGKWVFAQSAPARESGRMSAFSSPSGSRENAA